EALARPLRFGAVISRRPLYKTGGMLCAAAALMVLGLGFQGEQLSVFANRMMFGHRSYPARYRVIRVTPGDVANPTTVVRGESVGFEAEFRPYPATAWLELTDVHGRTTTLDMRETEKHVFTATVARVVDSFTYRVRGGDAVAEKDRSGRVYRIEARLRPVIKVGLDLRYPPYAGLTAAKVEGGSGEAIEGTRVQVNVELVQPAAIGGAAKKEIESIKLVYLSGVRALQEVPMKATSATSATLELPEPLQSSLRYTIWVKDKEGVTNYESIESQESPAPVFSLRAIADRPPKVAVTEPRTETVEVQDTLETVARAQAQDDYGILNVSLYWRVVPADYTQAESSKSQWHIEPLYQVGAASAPTRVSDLKAVISPKAMQAGVGDSVAFFVEARDHTAPAVLMPSLDMSKVPRGVGRSKEYTLVVIDEKTFKLRLHRQLTEVTQDFLRILGGWQGVDEKIEAPVAPPPEPKRDGAPQPKR
ncbi:hypothetical protein, partial [Zavarzinia sp.]|uniref:hypothetical protein n=1 Tax=Zavarzinia sp. TaxID=2027920 RepID=UPI003569F4B7